MIPKWVKLPQIVGTFWISGFLPKIGGRSRRRPLGRPSYLRRRPWSWSSARWPRSWDGGPGPTIMKITRPLSRFICLQRVDSEQLDWIRESYGFLTVKNVYNALKYHAEVLQDTGHVGHLVLHLQHHLVHLADQGRHIGQVTGRWSLAFLCNFLCIIIFK